MELPENLLGGRHIVELRLVTNLLRKGCCLYYKNELCLIYYTAEEKKGLTSVLHLKFTTCVYSAVSVCVCGCVHLCVCARPRAWVCASVRVCARAWGYTCV